MKGGWDEGEEWEGYVDPPPPSILRDGFVFICPEVLPCEVRILLLFLFTKKCFNFLFFVMYFGFAKSLFS